MNKQVRFCGADIYTDLVPRVELGVRSLGNEDYIGVCQKNGWDNPILVTVRKGKFIARPIIIRNEGASSYCYASDVDISSILSDEDFKYLNRIVKQSISSNVPLIEVGDRLDIDESVFFKHAVQCIDEGAFKAFTEEIKKDSSLGIIDFAKKISEKRRGNFYANRFENDINKIVLDRKEKVKSFKGFDVFGVIGPVTSKEIKDVYANSGIYTVNQDLISKDFEKINNELCEFLFETFKNRIANDIARNRIESNYRGDVSKEAIMQYTDKVNFPEDVKNTVIDEILNVCNDKEMVNNLFIARDLVKKNEGVLNKKLGTPYVLAVSEIINETVKFSKKQTSSPQYLTEDYVKSFSDNPDNIDSKDVSFVKNDLSNSIGRIVAVKIQGDLIHDLVSQYDNGISSVPITEDYLKAKYNIDDKTAQSSTKIINSMVEDYIESKSASLDNNSHDLGTPEQSQYLNVHKVEQEQNLKLQAQKLSNLLQNMAETKKQKDSRAIKQLIEEGFSREEIIESALTEEEKIEFSNLINEIDYDMKDNKETLGRKK